MKYWEIIADKLSAVGWSWAIAVLSRRMAGVGSCRCWLANRWIGREKLIFARTRWHLPERTSGGSNGGGQGERIAAFLMV